jgi:hypothetical protein
MKEMPISRIGEEAKSKRAGKKVRYQGKRGLSSSSSSPTSLFYDAYTPKQEI